MSEESIAPVEELLPPTHDAVDPEMLASMGDILSEALLFALGRNHLDGPIFEAGYMRIQDDSPIQQADVAFLQVEQVGQPLGDHHADFLKAIETSLAACHDPRYALLYLISSDGMLNNIYLGVASRSADAQPKLFCEQIGEFLCSNWPGARVSMVENYDRIAEHVHVPLSKYRYARALTGIPSRKPSDKAQSYPQGIDQLLRGLRGKPFLYMVIAEPTPEAQVTDVMRSCRTLSGQMHAFVKATIQRSRSRGESETVSESESDSVTFSKSTSQSKSTAQSTSKGALGTALDASEGMGKSLRVLGLGGLAAGLFAAGGPFLLSGLLGMFGQLLPSSSSSATSGESTSESESVGRSSSTSISSGTTLSDTLSFSREYLNKHAEACMDLLERTNKRFEGARAGGCWNVGVYMITDQEEVAAQAQAQLKALISGEASWLEPVRVHNLRHVWDGHTQMALDAFCQPSLRLASPTGGNPIDHPLGKLFEGLTTPLNTSELALLANLPMRETPGVRVQPTAMFSLNPPVIAESPKVLELGHVLDGGEEAGRLTYAIDADSLTKHVFITGTTGSGKSNTTRRLLLELMDKGINFMVIEPAKDEYVQMALAINASKKYKRKISVYMPGRTTWQGQKLEQLKLNPFDIVQLEGAETQVMPHMDRLKSIFNASFPMQEILPVILEEALVDLYASQGWLEEELPPAGAGFPTLEQMQNRITGLVRDKGYEQRITDNITAAMRTRIGSLLRGWKGKLFNHPASTPWPMLFDRPVVVNLQSLGDDADKCFTMALLLNFMYEYRQAQHESEAGAKSSELRHLAVFEEAHRVLRAAHPAAFGANPQAKMGEMFADILAEIRAYGQGLAIIDQVASKLVPDALKNTNLKIIHRVVSSEDRHAMAGTLALTSDQAEAIARLKIGQAIVSGIQDDMPAWVKIHLTPLPELPSGGGD